MCVSTSEKKNKPYITISSTGFRPAHITHTHTHTAYTVNLEHPARRVLNIMVMPNALSTHGTRIEKPFSNIPVCASVYRPRPVNKSRLHTHTHTHISATFGSDEHFHSSNGRPFFFFKHSVGNKIKI